MIGSRIARPARDLARLIEFFTKPGDLVLDPFAGVGGTLLGAAICRAPRRAVGFEIEQRWADVYSFVVSSEQGMVLEDLGTSDPGGPRRFDASSGPALARSSAPRTGVVSMPSASASSPARSKFIRSPP